MAYKTLQHDSAQMTTSCVVEKTKIQPNVW